MMKRRALNKISGEIGYYEKLPISISKNGWLGPYGLTIGENCLVFIDD